METRGLTLPTFKYSLAARRARSKEAFDRLRKLYPNPICSLVHRTPLQLLIATILSAQCTDERVNIVTKDLFKKYKTAEDFVAVPPEELEKDVQTCGFYRQKAKNIRATCQKIIDHHDGKVPQTQAELVKLNGVGRKTANVVLGECFGIPGVVVDTHCGRIARRLGLTKETDPTKVEHDLMKVWPKEDWTKNSHTTIYHGRATCQSRSPKCGECVVYDLCPFPHTREGKRIAK